MEPLISVIIPVYNMEPYLARCLDSILANSYQKLEILCVDDGSRDASLAILREYAEKDPRIVVIAKENGGVSSARNAGLDRMTGESFAFIDPDDFVHPQYFERLLHAMETAGAGMSLCGFRTVTDKDLPLSFETPVSAGDKLTVIDSSVFYKTHNYRSYGCCKLIRSALVRALRFREALSYSEDSVFLAELGEQNPELTVAVLPDPLYFYYQREDSLVHLAKLDGRLAVASVYGEKALASRKNESIFLDQAIKRGLSTRYLSAYILPDKAITRQCSRLLRRCGKPLKKTEIYSKKEKLLYTIFIYIPRAYWLFRSVTEPDMRKWELAERRKRREAKGKVSIQ